MRSRMARIYKVPNIDATVQNRGMAWALRNGFSGDVVIKKQIQ